MTDPKPAPGVRLTTAVGLILAIIGATWMIFLAFGSTTVATRAERGAAPGPADDTAPAAGMMPAPRALERRLLLESDLGTGSAEFSAVALNEHEQVIVIADDEGRLFEFELDADDGPAALLRSIRVRVGPGDVEGLAWISGSTYALLDEADGAIRVVDLGGGVREIDDAQVDRVITTGIADASGSGLEGVAPAAGGADDGVVFVVVEERPPTLHGISADGTLVWSRLLDVGIADASDVWVGDEGVYSVLSDESRTIVDLRFAADGTVEVVGRLDLTFDTGRFEQPEGLARSADGARLFVVGEAPGPARYSFGAFRFGPG